MNNNLGYGGFPSSNSSFQSFSSQYASTPTNNNARFQRPRFAYAGPPSYPRPRSSASKPNPDPYGRNYQNSGYDKDGMENNSVDYSHGYGDSMSMRNNFGDTSLHLNESLNMNQSRGSFNDSSHYVTCSESFYQSPIHSDYSNYDNNNLSFGPSDRGGHSNINTMRQQDTYLNTNVGGPALFSNNSIGSSNSVFRGLTGTFATSTKGTLGGNTRGRGMFGRNRGNARGRFQKRKPFGRPGHRSLFPYTEMGPKSTWRCDVCSIQFTSQIPLDMHLRGSKHAKKLKSQNAYNCIQGQIAQVKEVDKADGKKFYCELCDIIANSSLQLQMHLDGTKHKSKLPQPTENTEESKEMLGNKGAKVKEELNGKSNGGGVRRPAPAELSEPQPSKMAKFSCDICNIFVNSDVQLNQHLTSKKHKAKVEGKPIIKKRKFQKQDEESVQPAEQQPVEQQPAEQQSQNENKTKVEPTSVVGVKTLSASFVRSETLL